MILYEVSLDIDRKVVGEYLEWLEVHVEEMLKLPGFIEARIFKDQDEDLQFEKYVVHYFLVDEAAMNRYLKSFSEKMRSEALSKFPKQFKASRRILELKLEPELSSS